MNKGAFFSLLFGMSVIFGQAALAQDEAPDIDKIKAGAENGEAESEYQLGEAYHKGEGMPQDDHAAYEWYQKSADQGNTDAQMALGFIYRGGSGLPMDKTQSYFWFGLAASRGNDRAFELRNDVAWSMTETEINDARKRISAWKPTPNK